MFDRIDLLTRFAWLRQINQPMIIGNDLDALLSAQFLHDYLGWTIAGFYNYTTLYHDPHINPLDCTWVDLDIHHPLIGSIGHHILRPAPTDQIPDHQLTVNPNLLRGIDQVDFTHKYPLGTIHFLLWLHDQRLPKKRAATLLLWLADSAWINTQYYRSNVKAWLMNWLPVPELIATFDETNTGDFEEEMRDQILSVIDIAQLAEADNIQRRSKFLGLGGHQCVWNKPDELIKVRRVTDLIERKLGWKKPKFPAQWAAVAGQRRSGVLPDLISRHGSFDAF
ncbi:MAG: hypothetical protein KA765_06200, partial [Thermoflexales bacterium]|nr:hypothetical protein [Thermoflexales bacterium]